MKRVYILLGGLASADGWADSRGMLNLAAMCTQAHIPATVYTWGDYEHAAADMKAHPGPTILVGYSGGGSRATILNREFPMLPIDLMVLYDPSPESDMLPITALVKKAVCYHNERPLMLGLGGGILTAYPGQKIDIETIPIKEQHLRVDYDGSLHLMTMGFITAVKDT